MRLREIDFLRGLAVILVMFRHSPLIDILHQVGWVGVDLFFVLSGFLVSGLLFREYKKFNDVHAGQFLVRRGFKIYPLFYFTLAVGIFLESVELGHFPARGIVFSEALFLQSYIKGILGITWSLAVEEHFYFGLAFIVLMLIAGKSLSKPKQMLALLILILVACLSMRIVNNVLRPFTERTHLFPTHLRIDSLMFGVALAYFYTFDFQKMSTLFVKNRTMLYVTASVFLLTPFFFGAETFFMNTLGLTLLYLGFGILLGLFVTDPAINTRLDRLFSRKGVDLMSRVGFYSYGIYLWHAIVYQYFFLFAQRYLGLEFNEFLTFIIYFGLSFALGITFSVLIEQNFLKIRDIYFPRRVGAS